MISDGQRTCFDSSSLARMANLELRDLSHSLLTTFDFCALAAPRNSLRAVDLSFNFVTGGSFEWISSYYSRLRMSVLNVAHNLLRGGFPMALWPPDGCFSADMAHFPAWLTTLDISYNGAWTCVVAIF